MWGNVEGLLFLFFGFLIIFFSKWVPNCTNNVIAFIFGGCFIIFGFWEFFIYHEYKLSVRYVICECSLPVCMPYFFNSLTYVFHRANVFYFDEVKVIHLMNCAFGVISKLFAQPTYFLLSSSSLKFLDLARLWSFLN